MNRARKIQLGELIKLKKELLQNRIETKRLRQEEVYYKKLRKM